MSVSIRHVFAQGESLRALSRVAWAAATQGGSAAHVAVPELPGPWVERELPPRPSALVDAYLRHLGADPSWYRGILPPHLFPQWSFEPLSQALSALPYQMVRVMNAGAGWTSSAPIARGEALHVRARVVSVEQDASRALITQEVVTGSKSAPDALTSRVVAYVPVGDAKGGKAVPKTRPVVPLDVREVAFFRVGADAGLEFAKLTGDFNPVHWVPAYAKAAGFRSCILHGFSTLARAVEALHRSAFAGDVRRIVSVDTRFRRPLTLPARVGVYVRGDELWVGDAPGGDVYLEGRFAARDLVSGD